MDNLMKQQADSQVYASFMASPYLSIKHTSYFGVYDELLSSFRGRDIVFVEIGVLNGGSLFMWRDFIGDRARIIGIDANPDVKKWESHGFEIFIGDQADPDFWDGFFRKVGDVDVILDDGGHSNDQQIVTAVCCIPHIKDGGKLIIEDTHTSYMNTFGNPSQYSFISYAKHVIDAVNARFPAVDVRNSGIGGHVFSISFFESIVSFNVDRGRCFESAPVSNRGVSSRAIDFRDNGTRAGQLRAVLYAILRFGSPLRKFRAVRLAKDWFVYWWMRLLLWKRNANISRYLD
jgi:hypothetical protein